MIPVLIDRFAAHVASISKKFINTKPGQLFLGISLVGPLTFIPTVWNAWTAPDISALKTLTWPLMTVVNISVFIAVCHNGDWRVRLAMLAWIVLMLLTWIATLVR